jgi:2-methylaconitate cis-trans-isomerase PrpF
MRQRRVPAVFMRGGTSKAAVFHERDLPADRSLWPELFVGVLGSNDPNGRQLNGLGGGISSLSKVCVVGPPSRPDADIDYTFFQLSPRDASVDNSGNCGNMSSAMGPFAVDEGLVEASGEQATIRIHNTNTGKIILSRFALDDGFAAVDGAFELPGVSGNAAQIALDFLDPGGAKTGKLLPTGNPRNLLDVPGLGQIEASMVDAANPCVFVAAKDVGIAGTEAPGALEADATFLAKMEGVRQAASVAMGIARDLAEAATMTSLPKVACVAAPAEQRLLTGDILAADDTDIIVRMISVGLPHRAVPLTGALCLAVATKLHGAIPAELCRPNRDQVRIAQASGLTVVEADMEIQEGALRAKSASVIRTQRRLMDGYVYAPAATTPGFDRLQVAAE